MSNVVEPHTPQSCSSRAGIERGPAVQEDPSVVQRVKAALIGRALRTPSLHKQLLPERRALPAFGSDPLSSVAYATREMLVVLGLGGAALIRLARWLAAAIMLLLMLVTWGRAGAHVSGYWQQKLHNQSLSVLLSHLNLVPGVVVVHVPHQLSSGRPGREPPRRPTTPGPR